MCEHCRADRTCKAMWEPAGCGATFYMRMACMQLLRLSSCGTFTRCRRLLHDRDIFCCNKKAIEGRSDGLVACRMWNNCCMCMACTRWARRSSCKICTSCWRQQLRPQHPAAACKGHPFDVLQHGVHPIMGVRACQGSSS